MKEVGALSVLVAPLDWGLGHATRCVPIINELIRQGARVIIAANGGQKTLLKQEFPGLEFMDIPGYEIRFKPGILLKWGLFFRIPSIVKQIKREQDWLERTLGNRKIDAVISDNRYGLYSKNSFCVFITHQLCIQTGWGSLPKVGRWRLAFGSRANQILLKFNYKLINKFSACWVPDLEGNFSVAGILSHPRVLPGIPVKYIGLLSRFTKTDNKRVKNSLLILLSGPEPQRTRFENIVFRQLRDFSTQTIVIRGVPGEIQSIPFIREGIKILNHLPSGRMNELLTESEFIIATGGYSTIMDLLHLKRNAILVPTPGQTEQEYLGRYLHQKKWMYVVPQKNFNLKNTLNAFQRAEMEMPDIPETSLRIIIEEFITNCRAEVKTTPLTSGIKL